MRQGKSQKRTLLIKDV